MSEIRAAGRGIGRKGQHLLVLCFLSVFGGGEVWGQSAIVADHTRCDLSVIPLYWIGKAKEQFRISYGHTSHGSQIVTGMNNINELTVDDDCSVLCSSYAQELIYSYCDDRITPAAPAGTMSFWDRYPSGDLGHNGSLTWETYTRNMLGAPYSSSRNLVMWSWCGGVSDNTEAGINIYLNAMNQLEIDYPEVTFVYMTGHLDGTGETGNLHIRNNQIRSYCAANNKVLFDFADIESYDPDGNYFLDLNAEDDCDYYIGSTKYNWADQWCTANPGECISCGACAHSRCLNCHQKGKAFWWMMARLAGWNGCEAVAGDVTGDCTVDLSDYQVLAGWWLDTGCSRANDWCSWADVTLDDGEVNLDDFDELAGHWLGGS